MSLTKLTLREHAFWQPLATATGWELVGMRGVAADQDGFAVFLTNPRSRWNGAWDHAPLWEGNDPDFIRITRAQRNHLMKLLSRAAVSKSAAPGRARTRRKPTN